MEPNDIEREIMASGLDSVIGLYETEKAVERHVPGVSLDEGRRRAAESIRHLLEWGFLVAGDLASDGLLVPWGTTPADSVVRIEGLWRKLPGLTPVDVAWFRQTLDVASSKKCDR